MEQEINKIDIVPAVFVKYRDDGNVLLRCLQGKDTVDRAFEPNMFKKITNPKYLLLGITTGVNYMQLMICDGTEFENLFHEKWSVLLK
jgi:hypothetical protein